MNTFIELLERKIDGCDALGGLEREKAVYQSVLKDYKKQLTLTDVSQQRKLLLGYEIYNASEYDKKNNMKYLENLVDTYLDNNCD